MPRRTEKWNGIPIYEDIPPAPRGVAFGLIPRDYSEDPVTMFEPPSDIQIYPESEWEDRLTEQWDRKETIYHNWKIHDNGEQPQNLYQNGDPLCWGHSSTWAAMAARMMAGEIYVALSAYMVSMLATGYVNKGGWCGQSAKVLKEIGACSQEFWPQQNKSRSNDTPAMRANAARHKIDEEWRDLTRPIYGQEMTEAMVVACSLNNHPMALDFNWWGHSVGGAGSVVVERGSIGRMIMNSHGGDGFMILRGSKAKPDGAIAIRNLTAAA